MKDEKENYLNHPDDCACPHCAARRACAKTANPFLTDNAQGANAKGKNRAETVARSGDCSKAQTEARSEHDGELRRGNHDHSRNCGGDCAHAHGAERKEKGRELRRGHDDCHSGEQEHCGDCLAHDHGHEDCGCGHEHGHGHEDCGCGHEHGETAGKRATIVFLARAGISAILLALGAFLPLAEYVNLAFFIPAYLIIGYDVIFGAAKGIVKGKFLDERFLMVIASVGAFLISEAPEGVLVMLLYQIGEFLTDLSLARSKKSISALTGLRPDSAAVLRGGEEIRVAPDEVEIGERILVRAGERIPLDGIVRKGKTTLDYSALTGESVPIGKKEGEEVLSGAVNLDGVIEIEATKEFGDSAVMRILSLVGEASEKKTKTERFIKKFAKYYTLAVVVAAVLLAIVPPLAGLGEWMRWIQTALLFLVISCPCALVISVPLTYFAGVGGASKAGILIKGGSVLDALKKVKTVVFDKTGTLTEGVFEVTGVDPAEGVSEEWLKECARAAESLSNHPIAKSVIAAFGKPNQEITESKELSGRGVSVVVNGETVLAGNAKLMLENGVAFSEKESAGSVVYLCADGRFLGSVTVSDRVKSGAAEAIEALNQMGIKSYMLTGDRESAAAATAKELNLAGYRAELLSGGKVGALEEFLSEQSCAFVGDGVNDAPVITRADVGFAMGGMGQDAAIEAADAVIMDDKPEKVAKAVRIAKKTGRIATQNIVFALAVKLIVMILGIAGIADMWLAVFADVGVTLLAVLNAMRAYRAIGGRR